MRLSLGSIPAFLGVDRLEHMAHLADLGCRHMTEDVTVEMHHAALPGPLAETRRRSRSGRGRHRRVGQRVCREDSPELGTIVEEDGKIKVKWDNGQTSYFDRLQASNIKLKSTSRRAQQLS